MRNSFCDARRGVSLHIGGHPVAPAYADVPFITPGISSHLLSFSYRSSMFSKITPSEISVGLVLHLDPDALAQHGGEFSCPEQRRVRGGHFFVCLKVRGDRSDWLPLYSRPGLYRLPLPMTGRAGHEKWTRAECYYHAEQTWTASASAVAAAALAGEDRSTPRRRNRIGSAHLPNISHGEAA
jgi:hypothetical protein